MSICFACTLLCFQIFLVTSVESRRHTRVRRDTQLAFKKDERLVFSRSVNSPQVNKFLQVYHCSGDQGSTKVIIFYAILV